MTVKKRRSKLQIEYDALQRGRHHRQGSSTRILSHTKRETIMKDYLKLAAIVALFILGSASDTYADSNFMQRQSQEYHNMVERDARMREQHAQRRRDRETRRWRNEQRSKGNDWVELYHLFKEIKGDQK